MIDQEYKAWCAFQLHDLGLPVLPVHYPVGGHCSCRGAWTCGSPAKHPARWLKDLAEQSEDDIHQMLRECPPHNLGVSITGSHLIVLNVDPSGGGAQALAEFEVRRGGPLSPTLTVITGNGARHLYYRLPNHAAVRGDRLLFLHGVDVKTSGVVVVPPSRSIFWRGVRVRFGAGNGTYAAAGRRPRQAACTGARTLRAPCPPDTARAPAARQGGAGMRHRDAFGRDLRVGQAVNCPDGAAGQVYAVGRSQLRQPVVLVATDSGASMARHLSADVVGLRTVRR